MDSEMKIDIFGTKIWRNKEGLVHREDGPAIIYGPETKSWYINDELHREDGPAVIYSDGTKEWYMHGKRHRENGPARIFSDGSKEWWLDDKVYTEKQYREEIRKRKLSKLKF